MRYSKSNGYRNKYGNSRYEQKQLNRYDRSLKKKDKVYRSNKSYSSNKGVFAFIIIFLVIVVFARYLTNSMDTNILTFRGFLEFLSNAPSVSANWSLVTNPFVGNWGIFDWFRNIANFSWSIFATLICICDLLLDAIVYIFYFVRGLLFP